MSCAFRPLCELDSPQTRRRNLPHWEVPGATYFITFRLYDALPAGVRREIEVACVAWLRAHGIHDRKEVGLLSLERQREFRRLFTAQEEKWLDSGHGSCALRDPKCRDCVVGTLLAFDAVRYALDSFVVMPNHVHALVQPLGTWTVLGITTSWKKFSARRINVVLGRTGRLWQAESFDHIVRDLDQLERCRRYVEDNPRKARRKVCEYHLGVGAGISR